MSESLALVAVQLGLSARDFASEHAFVRCIEAAAEDAAQACRDAEHRLMVFPENTGHFLPLLRAPAVARRQPTIDRAMAALALGRPLSVLRSMWRARTLDHARAVLLAFMPDADRVMREIFSRVARRHRAFVVAGSHLRPMAGAVTNTSYTFDPRGQLVATTHKANLVVGMEDDAPGGLGLARGDADRLPVVDAPWGRLATLICYDGFCLPHTRGERFVCMGERADQLDVDVVANPSANPWPWNERWVFAQGDSQMLRREQWWSEGLPATLGGLARVRYGVTAHLCAEIFDMRFEGRSQILTRNSADQQIQVLGEAPHEASPHVVAVHVPVPRTVPRVKPAMDRANGPISPQESIA